MFLEALEFATRPPEGGRSVLVGGLFAVPTAALVAVAGLDPAVFPVVALAVVPWLILRGYYVRTIRAGIGHDRPLPPRFDGYVGLFADGLKTAVIATCYLLPGAAILAPLLYVRAVGADLEALVVSLGVPASASGGALSALGVLAVFGLMYLIGALYAIPVAVANYAHAGRFLAAFDVRRVASGAATEDYVTAWLVSVLLQAVALPVAYLLRVLLVGFFLHVVVMVGVHYCYGRGIGAGLGLEPATARPGSGGPPADRPEPQPAIVRADRGRLGDRPGDAGAVRPTLAPADDTLSDSKPPSADAAATTAGSADQTEDTPPDPRSTTSPEDDDERSV